MFTKKKEDKRRVFIFFINLLFSVIRESDLETNFPIFPMLDAVSTTDCTIVQNRVCY